MLEKNKAITKEKRERQPRKREALIRVQPEAKPEPEPAMSRSGITDDGCNGLKAHQGHLVTLYMQPIPERGKPIPRDVHIDNCCRAWHTCDIHQFADIL